MKDYVLLPREDFEVYFDNDAFQWVHHSLTEEIVLKPLEVQATHLIT